MLKKEENLKKLEIGVQLKKEEKPKNKKKNNKNKKMNHVSAVDLEQIIV